MLIDSVSPQRIPSQLIAFPELAEKKSILAVKDVDCGVVVSQAGTSMMWRDRGKGINGREAGEDDD